MPSCRDKGQQGARDPPAGPSPTHEGPHHESDRPLLFHVDGRIGALDPCVGAEVPQPHIGVPGERTQSQ